MTSRSGIGFIGSVIVDVVPEELESGKLVYSDGEYYLEDNQQRCEHIDYGTGGMALNNSINCAKMGADYPLVVVGKIGKDANGCRIRNALASHGIPAEHLVETSNHPTSTTQVLLFRDGSGNVNRTFRHYFGAMGDFGPDDIDMAPLENLRIAMLGYCLLMPLFDREDPCYGTILGGVLERLQDAGVLTCIDFITPKRGQWHVFRRFRKVLKYVDILSVGDDQAEGLTGCVCPAEAAKKLVGEYGVGTAVIHCGGQDDSVLFREDTGLITSPIFNVPPEEYVANPGAGDAFTSGLLHGIHSGWDWKPGLDYANAAAAVSLGSTTCTAAMRDETYLLEYMRTRPRKVSQR